MGDHYEENESNCIRIENEFVQYEKVIRIKLTDALSTGYMKMGLNKLNKALDEDKTKMGLPSVCLDLLHLLERWL